MAYKFNQIMFLTGLYFIISSVSKMTKNIAVFI